MKYYMANEVFRRSGIPFLIAIDHDAADPGERMAMEMMWKQNLYHDITGFLAEGDIANQTIFGWVYGVAAAEAFYEAEKSLNQRASGLFYSDVLQEE